MHDALIHRLATLVSYGTAFLHDENSLYDWCRHGAFKGARGVFRRASDNVLLADDFTLWLPVLKGEGAVRLSLHDAAEFAPDGPPDPRRCKFAVVVHYADHYRIWMVGEEPASWRDVAEYVHGWEGLRYRLAKTNGGAIDSYWGGENIQGRLRVQTTDWKTLAESIGTSLDVPMPLDDEPAALFVLARADDARPAALPILPVSEAMPAHRLAAALHRVQLKFERDTDPSNPANIYLSVNQEGEARLQNWGDRLDKWMVDVLMRGANDSTGRWAPCESLSEPAPEATNDDEAGDAPPRPATRKRATLQSWGARIGFAIATAVFSLIFLATAHIVAAYSWLAVPIALIFVLYLHVLTRDNQG